MVALLEKIEKNRNFSFCLHVVLRVSMPVIKCATSTQFGFLTPLLRRFTIDPKECVLKFDMPTEIAFKRREALEKETGLF